MPFLYRIVIRNFDLGLSEITKLFVFFDTVRSKKRNQIIQENISKDLPVQKCNTYNSSQISHLKYVYVHTLYILYAHLQIHTFSQLS